MFLSTWFTVGLGTLHFYQTPTGDSDVGAFQDHTSEILFSFIFYYFWFYLPCYQFKNLFFLYPQIYHHTDDFAYFFTENKRTELNFLFPPSDNHLECLLLFFFSWIHPYTTPLFIRGKRTFYPRLTSCPVHRHHLQFHLQFPSSSLPPSVPLPYSLFLPPSLSLLL